MPAAVVVPVSVLLSAPLSALVVLTAAPAGAATTAPAPTPSLTPSALVGPQPDVAAAVTFPVQPLTFPVQDLVFASASQDGAVTDTGGRDFRLSSDVLFAFDQATLTARAKTEIARIATELKSPTAGAGAGAEPSVRTVTVTGFTDDVGGDRYNVALSRRRAEAVRKVLAPLLGSGVAVRASGKGEAGPVAGNRTARGRSLNRRVEIRGRP
jgi:outer membrane protein OmpA-like peptidoglycan-associated protein